MFVVVCWMLWVFVIYKIVIDNININYKVFIVIIYSL